MIINIFHLHCYWLCSTASRTLRLAFNRSDCYWRRDFHTSTSLHCCPIFNHGKLLDSSGQLEAMRSQWFQFVLDKLEWGVIHKILGLQLSYLPNFPIGPYTFLLIKKLSFHTGMKRENIYCYQLFQDQNRIAPAALFLWSQKEWAWKSTQGVHLTVSEEGWEWAYIKDMENKPTK